MLHVPTVKERLISVTLFCACLFKFTFGNTTISGLELVTTIIPTHEEPTVRIIELGGDTEGVHNSSLLDKERSVDAEVEAEEKTFDLGGAMAGGGGGQGGKKENKGMMEKILPVMIIPFLISSAIVPFMVIAIKVLLIKTLLVGKVAAALTIFNMFRQRQHGGGVFNHNVGQNKRAFSETVYDASGSNR